MPQSSSDVFSPRHRLPLDPFAAVDHDQQRVKETDRRYWEVDLERSGVHRSGLQQQVILVLGEPQPADILPLLASSHLSHSLVLIATHAPGSLGIPANLPSGPAVRVLRLSAPLNVHDAGALRLVNFLERAQRVARLWRHSAMSGKGKGPAAASQRIIQLAQDGPDGEFTVVEPFVFAFGKDDHPRKSAVMSINAQSQSQTLSTGGDQTLSSNKIAEKRSSQLYPSPPQSIASASQTSIASPTPKKHTPAQKRFSILSLPKSASSTSLRDSYSQSPKQKRLHKSSAQLPLHAKESVQALEIEHALLNHPSSHIIQAKQAHIRTFDAIVNFLPQGQIPDKALLKCAILVTTLSAQYLALPPGAEHDGEIEEEDEENEANNAEHGFVRVSSSHSRSLPAHIRTIPAKDSTQSTHSSSSLNTVPTIAGLANSISPPSSFPSIPSLQPLTEQTPTQNAHRYHYQRRASQRSSSNASLPTPPPMSSYPSSSSSVVSKEPQRRFSMMSVFSSSSPSSSSSLASRPDLHAHISTSTDTSRSSLWAGASSATSLQTTPATSPLPSPVLSGVLSDVDLAKGAETLKDKSAKRKSLKHRFSVIFGARPEVQWKTAAETELHTDAQLMTSVRPRSMSTFGSTRSKKRPAVLLNAHIVHVLPYGWTPPEDLAQSRRHSYASTASSASASGSGSHHHQLHLPSVPRPHPHLHHHRSGSGDSDRSGKPKLVQGIEQFLLSFAFNTQQQQQQQRHSQPVHDALSSPSGTKKGKRPSTSTGIVSPATGIGKAGWSDPGVSVSLSKGQLASLVEAEGKKEMQKRSGRSAKRGRGPPVPLLLGPGVFGRGLSDGFSGEGWTVGEIVLLGGFDAQSAGRAWVDAADVVVVGGHATNDDVLPSNAELPTSAAVPTEAQSSPPEMAAEVDSAAEDQLKAESDEGASVIPTELDASLLPSPPDSQSSSVRSRSESHSGSGGSSEESAATSEEGVEDDLQVEEQGLRKGDIQEEEAKAYAVDPSYLAPPERAYSGEGQYPDPPMMITLTSPTVASPSPTLPSHSPRGHRRLASNESASLSTSALPLSGAPPSSWNAQVPEAVMDASGVAQKGVKVPRAIYVASGSLSSSRSRSDSRLPLPAMDEPLSSSNLKVAVDSRDAVERKRVKSHDGFGSALRKLGLGVLARRNSRVGEGLKAR